MNPMNVSAYLRHGVLALLLSLVFDKGYGQCPTCVPDPNCVSTNGFPSVCPATPPNGIAGVYYEEQMTFNLPATFTDPSSGITVDLVDVTITSVTGLPFGLQFTLNDADGTFHPSAGDNLGCATTCGTPLLPGSYDVVINVSIVANAFGFPVTQQQSFASTMIIEPGEGSAGSFTYDNIADCGGLEVNFEAVIAAPVPSITTYSWDFGNGQTSTDVTPNTITYDNPGQYSAQLTTTISDFVVSSVNIASLSSNWGGDEDILFGPADPYFTITDGNGNVVLTSTTVDNVGSNNWTDLSLMLTTPPYLIQVFDEDDITADDDLGTAAFLLEEGAFNFDMGNGTMGSIQINLEVTSQYTDSTTVSVFPDVDPTIVQVDNGLNIPDPSLTNYVWYLNGVLLDAVFGPSLLMTAGGQYYAEVSNEYGCTATSETITYCPAFAADFDEAAMELFVDDTYNSYQWYFNGLAIDGANNAYLPVTSSGNYAVEVTTSYGCEYLSEVYILTIGVEEKLGQKELTCYPNPAENQLFIRTSNNEKNSAVQVYNLIGDVVVSFAAKKNDGNVSIDVSELAPGVYFAQLNNKRIRFVKR
jgi:hypothetical protein